MLNKKSVEDVAVAGKRVLVRCDFNVPLDADRNITDETRIDGALPTIQYLIKNNAKVILCSHMGKPKGEPKPELSLAPVAKKLSEKLGKEVIFAADDNVVGENAKKAVEAYGGKIIDIPYTYDPQIKELSRKMRARLAMPEYRRKRLKQLLGIRPIVKALEVHNGITGLIAEKTVVEHEGRLDQFDAMWISSLCDSTAKGKPDIELVDMTSRFRTIDDVTEVTTKPIIFDGDTGGLTEHFVYTVRSLEKMGVSAVIIEDKTGLKKNSLFGTDVAQTQDSIEHFSQKIRAGKNAQLTDDFMIIARIESLILERGMEDALKRATAFVKAGADGIMIHSRKKDPAEILEFCDKFRMVNTETPLVVVPSSFNTITEEELAVHGVNLVIYANQLTRSAFPAMQDTAREILKYHRAKEVDDRLLPIKDIITLIDTL